MEPRDRAVVAHASRLSERFAPDGRSGARRTGRCRWSRLDSSHEHDAPCAGVRRRRRPSCGRRPVDGVDVLGALSPSRASDFMTCPLLYRYRTIDRLPEEPSATRCAAPWCTRCSRTSSTCRRTTRTPDQARDLLVPTWDSLLEAEPALAELFTDEGRDVAEWLASCRIGARPLLHAGGPAAARAGRARALRRGAARLQAAAAGLRRPARHRARRRHPRGRLQDRALRPGVVRGQGAVPDEVLRAGHLAHPRRRPGDAPAGLPRQRRDAALRPGRGRPPRHRAQGRGDLAGHRARPGVRRLAAPQVPAVRLVLLPVAVPRVRRHSPAAARPPRRLRASSPRTDVD